MIDKEKLIKSLYSRQFKEHSYRELKNIGVRHANIYEYKNFLELCLIPLFRDWVEIQDNDNE